MVITVVVNVDGVEKKFVPKQEEKAAPLSVGTNDQWVYLEGLAQLGKEWSHEKCDSRYIIDKARTFSPAQMAYFCEVVACESKALPDAIYKLYTLVNRLTE